jgi:RimJ/RimL family protein N-acetyltransferase
MDFSLRPLTGDDVPALQAVYDAAGDTFTRWFGRPAAPGQAAADFQQASDEPGRYQFGIFLTGRLVGLADCRLETEFEGQAHIGLLLLGEPYNDAAIAGLALRILIRWLSEAFGVTRLETGVAAHSPEDIAFWQSQGFSFTGQQYRRDLGDFAPRFLVMAKDL